MELPNKDVAYVQRSKLMDYLLSETHSVGQFKASFLSSIGFDKLNADVLQDNLIRIAQSEEVQRVVESPHGTKYVIDGFLTTTEGMEVSIRTVWIIDKNQERPRFVTAYPL